jgi:hypothetical protein
VGARSASCPCAQRFEQPHQHRGLDRLGQMAVEAGFAGLPLVFFLSVVAEGDQVRIGGLSRLAQGAGEVVAGRARRWRLTSRQPTSPQSV